MATTVGGIRVRILGDDSDLQKTLGESTKQLAKYGAAAAAAGAAAATALTVQGLKAVDAQAKLARSLDTTIDSLRAMQLAASDAGLDGLEGSLARLNRRLGAAERGSGAAAHAVEALKLDLGALSDMDVDERMATIADAIKDSGVSMQVAARHAQDLGFEQREAAAFFMQGGDAIRGYREEVEALGLSMTEIDAAKVEAANDAFSRIGTQLEVVSQRLAIEVAPILTAVSQMFMDAAKDAGGFGEATSSAFNSTVKGAGFVMDAVEGIRRVFLIVGKVVAGFGLGVQDVMLTAADAILNKPVAAANELVDQLNRLPGVDVDPIGLSGLGERIQSELETVRNAQAIMMDDIHETLMAPLPSDQFQQFVDDAREASEQAAREFQGLGEGLDLPGIPGAQGGEQSDEEKEKQEKLQDRLADRLDKIRQANMTELELLREKFAEENEIINEALEQKMITEQEWAEMMKEQKARQEQELTEIENQASEARQRIAEAEAKNKQQIMGDALSAMTTLMNSESRKMFEIGKVAAIAQSMISTYQGMSKALELGWPLGPIAAAAIGAAGFANVAAIKSQSFGGGGGGGAASATQNVNAQTEQVQSATRNVNVDLGITGGDSRDRAIASSIVDQINDEIERGGRINRIGVV